MHRLHGVEHAFGVLDLPDQVQGPLPRHEPASLQEELAVARILAGAQPEHQIAERRVVAQVVFELLEQMLAEPRSRAAVEVRLEHAEQQVRKPVVFDDEALVL